MSTDMKTNSLTMLKLTDICCRMITTDGVSVTLDERIWMNKLCDRNEQAREYRDQMLKDYKFVSKSTQ